MDNMFYNATLDTEIYDEILINWANLSSLKNNTPFHAGNSKYSSSASDKRNYIITNYNWTITDGGLYFSGEETPVPSSSGGGGGSGGGGSTIPTIIFSKEQFEKGYSANLAVGSRFEVNVENKEHHVMLNEMTSLTASITISSEPQNATLVVGESKKFEVNEDNYYDLLVTLNSEILYTLSGAFYIIFLRNIILFPLRISLIKFKNILWQGLPTTSIKVECRG